MVLSDITNTHMHTEDCVFLARARVRVLRSEIRMNQMIIDARQAHINELYEVVLWIQRNVARASIRDIIRMIPEIRPYLEDSEINGLLRNNSQ